MSDKQRFVDALTEYDAARAKVKSAEHRLSYVLRAHYGREGVVIGHRLVRRGLYRCVRNPSYLGLSLVFLGAIITFQSGFGLVVFLIGLAPAVGYRIRLEEELLERNLGDEYREYVRHTKRHILFPLFSHLGLQPRSPYISDNQDSPSLLVLWMCKSIGKYTPR